MAAPLPKVPTESHPGMSWLQMRYAKAQKLFEGQEKWLAKNPPTPKVQAAYLKQVNKIMADLEKDAKVWVEQYLPMFMDEGITYASMALNEKAMRSLLTRNALAQIQKDTFSDLAAMTPNVTASAKTFIREYAKMHAEYSIQQGLHPWEVARKLRKNLDLQGIGFVDKAGRKWKTDAYARMVMRTKTAQAYNTGTVFRSAESQVHKFRVLDGTHDFDCAVANGNIVTAEWAMANPVAHPNCTRAFAPVTIFNDKPLTTAKEKADKAEAYAEKLYLQKGKVPPSIEGKVANFQKIAKPKLTPIQELEEKIKDLEVAKEAATGSKKASIGFQISNNKKKIAKLKGEPVPLSKAKLKAASKPQSLDAQLKQATKELQDTWDKHLKVGGVGNPGGSEAWNNYVKADAKYKALKAQKELKASQLLSETADIQPTYDDLVGVWKGGGGTAKDAQKTIKALNELKASIVPDSSWQTSIQGWINYLEPKTAPLKKTSSTAFYGTKAAEKHAEDITGYASRYNAVEKLDQDAKGYKWNSGEKSAIRSYTGSAYHSINGWLREGGGYETSWGYQGAVVDRIDSAMLKNPTKTAIITKRGVSSIGSTLEDAFRSGKIQKGAIIDNFDKGYSSTSPTSPWGGRVNITYRVPEGSKGLWVRPVSSHTHEDEFLLGRDLRYRVVDYRAESGTYGNLYIELEVIP